MQAKAEGRTVLVGGEVIEESQHLRRSVQLVLGRENSVS